MTDTCKTLYPFALTTIIVVVMNGKRCIGATLMLGFVDILGLFITHTTNRIL